MSSIYFVRHGQAGTRDNYDALSGIGRQQARRLGEYLVRNNVVFQSAISGGMTRQRETAAEVRDAYVRAGLEFPCIDERPGWNEFDLDAVFGALAPVLAAESPDFRAEYEQLRAEALAGAGDPTAEINRRWTRCDVDIIQAWISGKYHYAGETWDAFGERIRGCKLPSCGESGSCIVFTSATPIALRAGAALDLYDHRVLRLAGVLYNASYSVLRARDGFMRLISFNNIPHLTEPDLQTHR